MNEAVKQEFFDLLLERMVKLPSLRRGDTIANNNVSGQEWITARIGKTENVRGLVLMTILVIHFLDKWFTGEQYGKFYLFKIKILRGACQEINRKTPRNAIASMIDNDNIYHKKGLFCRHNLETLDHHIKSGEEVGVSA